MTVLAVLLVLAQDPPPEKVAVQVKNIQILREGPDYRSPKVAEAKLGDEFKFIAYEGSWVKVGLPGDKTAYIHKSAVIDRKKYVPPPAEGTEGSTGGMALATKGFTPQMEAQHKAKNNLHAAYAKLDKIEATPAHLKDPSKVDQRLAAFVKEGKLTP